MRRKLIFWGILFITSSTLGFVLGWVWLSRRPVSIQPAREPAAGTSAEAAAAETALTDLSFRQLDLADAQLRIVEPAGWHILPFNGPDQGPIWSWLAVPEATWVETRWPDEVDDLMLDEYTNWWQDLLGNEEDTAANGEATPPAASGPTPVVETPPPGPAVYIFVGPNDQAMPHQRAEAWFALWAETALWDPDSFRLELDALERVPGTSLATWRLPWSYSLYERPFEAEMWIVEGGRGQDVVLIAQAPQPLWTHIQQVLTVMGKHIQITPRTEGDG